MEQLLILAVSAVIVGAIAKRCLDQPFVRVATYAFVLLPVAVIHMIVLGFLKKSDGGKGILGSAILILYSAIVISITYYSLTGFQPEDIEAVKSSIKTEFEKREGVKVVDVSLVKESRNKLFGFVKINVNGMDFSKSCEASHEEGGDNFIWRCN